MSYRLFLGGILAYLEDDGKFSEFAHKARWGIPNTTMTRAAIGSPDETDVADMMLWLQQLGGSGFAINPGLSGNQVWLIGAAPSNGNTAEIPMTIPEGAMWGAAFNPADLTRTAWGTGTVSFTSCGAGHIALFPNEVMLANGFTSLEYDIRRDLLTPGIECPTSAK